MGEVIAFPNLPDRKFSDFEEFLRAETRMGPSESEVWDACIAEVRSHWDRIHYPIKCSLSISTTPDLTHSQLNQVHSQVAQFAKEIEGQIQAANAGNMVYIARLVYEKTALKLGALMLRFN